MPDFAMLRRIQVRGVIVNQPGFDARLRFRLPASSRPAPASTRIRSPGLPIARLAPYWAPRLGRRCLAYQASPRGGVLRVTLAGRFACACRTAAVDDSPAVELRV